MEAVVPVLFYGKPGDLVRVQRSDWDRNGSWRWWRPQYRRTRQGDGPGWSWRSPDVRRYEVSEMWTSDRRKTRQAGESWVDWGEVTLEGDPAGAYLDGERRQLAVYGPGGYCWKPALGTGSWC